MSGCALDVFGSASPTTITITDILIIVVRPSETTFRICNQLSSTPQNRFYITDHDSEVHPIDPCWSSPRVHSHWRMAQTDRLWPVWWSRTWADRWPECMMFNFLTTEHIHRHIIIWSALYFQRPCHLTKVFAVVLHHVYMWFHSKR
jgi:hypothetical protein